MAVAIDRPQSELLYERVARHILGRIEQGTLRVGDRAPSLRQLSRQQRVSIATVKQAYAQLEAQGVLRARPQSGFYVRGLPQDESDPPRAQRTCCTPRRVRIGEVYEEIFQLANDAQVVPLGAAVPSVELLPVGGLLRATRRAAGRFASACLDYSFPPGLLSLRRQIARRYQDLGMDVSPDEVIVTSGASEALAMALQAVTRRGDIVAVESPIYFSVLRLIEHLGLLAVEIDTDPDEGLRLDALEHVLETMEIKAILTVPNYNNPTGAFMPEATKRRLAALVAEHRVPLIEDDVYGDVPLEGERPSPIRAWDEDGRIITCASFSKTLAPGYRIGWVLTRTFYHDVLEWKQATMSAVATLPQLAVSEYLASGEYDRHLQRLRRALREQVGRMRYLIARHFPQGTRVSRPRGGFVLWVEMPRGCDCMEVFRRARSENISITPGILFSAVRRYRHYIRINCGFRPDQEIEQAIRRLGDIVAEVRGR